MGIGHLSGAMRFVAVFLKREDGGSAAEFAMVALPMVLFTLAILEIGTLMFAYNDLHNAAREAARRLAVDEALAYGGGTYDCRGGTAPTPGTIEAIACEFVAGFVHDIQIATQNDGIVSPYVTCNQMTVTFSTTLGNMALFDLFGILGSRPLDISASMITEYDSTSPDPGSVCT